MSQAGRKVSQRGSCCCLENPKAYSSKIEAIIEQRPMSYLTDKGLWLAYRWENISGKVHLFVGGEVSALPPRLVVVSNS